MADRPLPLQELDSLLRDTTIAVDKRLDSAERVRAIERLRNSRHRYVLPTFLAVARDATNDRHLRQSAVFAIAAVPDKKIIPLLIEMLDERDRDVANSASERLWHITGHSAGLDRGEWSRWWLRNFDRADLKWDEALVIY